jgi:hypothetical protein
MDAKLELARQVHAEVCGCDDKRCETTTEIYDWLSDGDTEGLTLEQIVAEWNEYSS